MKRTRFRFGLRTWFFAFTFVCVYVGGYILLLDPTKVVGPRMIINGNLCYEVAYETGYRHGGSVATCAFVPLNYLDRLARPEYWHLSETIQPVQEYLQQNLILTPDNDDRLVRPSFWGDHSSFPLTTSDLSDR